MIFWGILLLVIGIVLWAVGSSARVPAPVATAGWVCAAIGAVLLVVGLVLMLVYKGTPEVVDDPNAMAALLTGLI